MTLEAINDIDRIALSADWVELAALRSPRGAASSADLVRSRAALVENEHERVVLGFDNGQGEEELEEEILESTAEEWVSDVREELAIRIQTLGESYPFQIRSTGQAWRLTLVEAPTRHDHLLYICCLLVTARRYGLVVRQLSEMDKVIQIVAYLVAGKIVQGDSFWFGYPRPDSTTMRAAVEKLLEQMGFESPAIVPPMWSIGAENDGGVDIVAWKNFGDGLSSRLVVYGQVASGKNWEGKPVSNDVEATFKHWLGDYGQRYYLPAMFIPWPQYVTVEASRERSFRQRVTEISVKQEKLFGLTVDRGRIAELAGSVIVGRNGDEETLINYLREWRTRAIAMLAA